MHNLQTGSAWSNADVGLQRLLGGLDARRSGGQWIARCPAHHDHTPSLSITTAGEHILVHCFVCAQPDVVHVLKLRGLWPANASGSCNRMRRPLLNTRETRHKASATADFGLRLWAQALSLHDSSRWPPCLGRYLAGRGLEPFEPCTRMRFHPRLRHSNGQYFPAMLVLATDVADVPGAVQATYLQADGSGKAGISPCRRTFGSTTACTVRLLEGDDVLILAEGVETALSVAQATGEGAYALLGTGGLKTIELPDVYRDRRIVVAADNDLSGAGWVAAKVAAQRLQERGFLDVRLALPPPPGSDYNDLLRSAA